MVEVRNHRAESRRLRGRLVAAMLLVLACFGVLIARLTWLQLHRHEDFSAQAEENRIALVPIAPSRGVVFDRNGVVLAENVSMYTLELSPKRIGAAKLEATIDELARIVDISAGERRRFRRLVEDFRSAESLPLKSRLTDEEVAKLAAQRFRFNGVEIRARLFRQYPLGETAAHALGYIGRISQTDKRRLEEQELGSRYAGSTHIGKIGVELSYEQELLGRPGHEEVEVSAGGRIVRTLSRTPPQAGKNLVLAIDVRLQKLAENLYGNRRGALVAIEPATGDVLAMVSRPSFDPNLFIDGIDLASWQALNENPDHPLLNRPLRGAYPPGSTYKPFMALAALGSGFRAPGDTIFDPGFFMLGDHKFRDSRPGGHGTVDLRKSIVVSSDTYYYKLAYEMGVDRIHDFMKPWGFGQITGIDVPHEAAGILPSTQWKLKRYGKKWFGGETPSVGIGQGYNAFTMLQLAYATAILANDGVAMKPHVVRYLEDPVSRERQPIVEKESHRIALKPEHLALVKSAMVDVNRFGTSRAVFANAPYVAAGKTGTAQVIGIKQNEKYDAKRIAERHRDHSLFMVFAPVDRPKIAIALIVENGGFGAQAAAPIARQLLDFHLMGKLPDGFPNNLLPELPALEEMRDVPEPAEPPPGEGREAARS